MELQNFRGIKHDKKFSNKIYQPKITSWGIKSYKNIYVWWNKSSKVFIKLDEEDILKDNLCNPKSLAKLIILFSMYLFQHHIMFLFLLPWVLKWHRFYIQQCNYDLQLTWKCDKQLFINPHLKNFKKTPLFLKR